MKTPCIAVCRLENDYCVGCKRSREEIRKWMRYDDAKRTEIMEELKTRCIDNNNRV